ncbi:hypothetical protein HDU85_001422 [Gaertneriomyces sp. JEL0708]|nr:hypothetical protein HDU85_001422 [Gaertneriomyces sp. JEL0708]
MDAYQTSSSPCTQRPGPFTAFSYDGSGAYASSPASTIAHQQLELVDAHLPTPPMGTVSANISHSPETIPTGNSSVTATESAGSSMTLRSPRPPSRHRSVSDLQHRPLFVDTSGTGRHRANSFYGYTSHMMSPMGSPVVCSTDSLASNMMVYPMPTQPMGMHTIPEYGGAMYGSFPHYHVAQSTGYLDPAHLGGTGGAIRTRRRAPSAPVIVHPGTLNSPTAQTPTPPSASPIPSAAGGGPAFSNGYTSYASSTGYARSPYSAPSPTGYVHPPHLTYAHPSQSYAYPLSNKRNSTSGPVPELNPRDESFKQQLLSCKFPHRDAAIGFLRTQAKIAGFSVLVRTSRPDYVVIICNCGRRVKASAEAPGDKKRRRKRKTAMTGCEWHVILFRRGAGTGMNNIGIHGAGKLEDVERMWEFRATTKMEHNHPLVGEE